MDIVNEFDLSKFILDFNQTRLLISSEYYLIKKDIQAEREKDKKIAKAEWLDLWTEKMNKYLLDVKNTLSVKCDIDSIEIIQEEFILKEALLKEKERLGEDHFTLYLLLMEMSLFRAYYPIINFEGEKDDLEVEEGKLKAAINEGISLFKEKLGKNLYRIDEKIWLAQSRILAENILELDGEIIDKFNSSYERSIRKINGLPKYMLSGPIGISIITSLGNIDVSMVKIKELSRALDSLGIGSILIKGEECENNIVSGGTILQAGNCTESEFVLKLLMSPDYALSQTAKLEVVIKEVILSLEKDIVFAKEIIKKHSQAICELRNELLNLKQDEEKNKKLIEDTNKALNIMNKGLNIMEQDFLDNKKVKLLKRIMFIKREKKALKEELYGSEESLEDTLEDTLESIEEENLEESETIINEKEINALDEVEKVMEENKVED